MQRLRGFGVKREGFVGGSGVWEFEIAQRK